MVHVHLWNENYLGKMVLLHQLSLKRFSLVPMVPSKRNVSSSIIVHVSLFHHISCGIDP